MHARATALTSVRLARDHQSPGTQHTLGLPAPLQVFNVAEIKKQDDKK